MDHQSLANVLESLMLVAFGCAWPANIAHSLKRKSSVGKSLVFLVIVILGYLFGISAKIAGEGVNYVCLFYIANLLMVAFDLFLFFLYRGRESKAGRGPA
ncbi:MAG: hypothetical protein LBF40_03925 [Deltaproteobacteria bacterium]|jgi:hypothetical protein|nr:hypothetical protein [Deltaproteobacteria bacterium]